jgi:hypothetical protein
MKLLSDVRSELAESRNSLTNTYQAELNENEEILAKY